MGSNHHIQFMKQTLAMKMTLANRNHSCWKTRCPWGLLNFVKSRITITTTSSCGLAGHQPTHRVLLLSWWLLLSTQLLPLPGWLSNLDIARLKTPIVAIDNISISTPPSYKPFLWPKLSPQQTWLTTVTPTLQASLTPQTLQVSVFASMQSICRTLVNSYTKLVTMATHHLHLSIPKSLDIPFAVVTMASFHRTGVPSMPIPCHLDNQQISSPLWPQLTNLCEWPYPVTSFKPTQDIGQLLPFLVDNTVTSANPSSLCKTANVHSYMFKKF